MVKFDFIRASKKATLETLPLLVRNDNLICEEKFDGSRFGAVILDGSVQMISRNGIDRAINVPYIVEQLLKTFPPNTVLDGEVVHLNQPHNIRWEMARSVMGTNEFNDSVEQAHYVIYDIQCLGGIHMTSMVYSERRQTLKSYFSKHEEFPTALVNGNLAVPRAWKLTQANRLWNDVVTIGGGEGIMIKDLTEREYAKSWTKVKKDFTIDAFVIGIENGKGKYEGQVGSLILAVYSYDAIYEIGKCSGMTDDERRDFTNRAIAGTLKGMVVEVKANEVTKNLKLRHPQFVRERTDKPASECLLQQLQEQLQVT